MTRKRDRESPDLTRSPVSPFPPAFALGKPRIDERKRSPADEEVGAVVHGTAFLGIGIYCNLIPIPSSCRPNQPELWGWNGVGTLSSLKIIKNN